MQHNNMPKWQRNVIVKSLLSTNRAYPKDCVPIIIDTYCLTKNRICAEQKYAVHRSVHPQWCCVRYTNESVKLLSQNPPGSATDCTCACKVQLPFLALTVQYSVSHFLDPVLLNMYMYMYLYIIQCVQGNITSLLPSLLPYCHESCRHE